MPPLIEPATTYFIPARHFVMDSSAGRAFQNIKQGNSRLAELYGLLEDEYEKEVKRGPAAAEAFLQSGALKDEGMALVLQILLMGECSSFFGSLSSNVGILVYDLQTALATRRRTTPYFFDANGRVYCGCGASFCMQLERKAIRQPEWTVKQIVENFKY